MNTFRNRTDAGQQLSVQLRAFAYRPNAIILALPRGGIPVAFQVASNLKLPLDVLTVRKLGVPGNVEVAMGAIASGGAVILNKRLIRALEIPETAIQAIAEREEKELERRESLYRRNKPFPELYGKDVILIDDGIATGSTMSAAIDAVRHHGASTITIATPVAPSTVARELQKEVDRFIALATPEHFVAVGQWYDDFSETTDEEVQHLLEQAEHFGEPQLT